MEGIINRGDHPRVAVLSGGVGGARFLDGLTRVLPAQNITAIVNTGDDLELGGLYISPDVDIVTCTLGGVINENTGWGIANDTFACRDFLLHLGVPIWFNVGDRDLALHLYRASRLRAGDSPTRIAGDIAERLNVRARILPMSDGRFTSMIRTGRGDITFEEYLIKNRAADEILDIYYTGDALPTKEALEAIRGADLIFFAPSNPFVSIGTILSLPGMREALRLAKAPIVAISPIVSGNAIKGPAAAMLKAMGHEPSACGVAALYRELAQGFVLDMRDSGLLGRIEGMGYCALATDSLIADVQKREGFARQVLRFAQEIAHRQGDAYENGCDHSC